ncbi:MAG: hypothetical protein Q8P32_02445 [Candidatus Komeilibacteria bacterium]|nr:hypothetical protein [Candidatus Komeilibacteria bacterium]
MSQDQNLPEAEIPIDPNLRQSAGLKDGKTKIIVSFIILAILVGLALMLRSVHNQGEENKRVNDSLALAGDTLTAAKIAMYQEAIRADSLRKVAQQQLVAKKLAQENTAMQRLAKQAEAQAEGRLGWRLKSFFGIAGLPWWFVAGILAITLLLFIERPKKSKLLPAWLFIGFVVAWMTMAFLHWPPRPLKLEIAQAQDSTKTAKDDSLLAELTKYRQQDSTWAAELKNVYTVLKDLNSQMAHVKTAVNRPPIANASGMVATTVSGQPAPLAITMANGSQLPAHPVTLTGTPVAANAIDPPAGLKARDEYSAPAQPQQTSFQPQPTAAQSGQANTAQPVFIDPPVWPAK